MSMTIVSKVWGREQWIVNNDKYCGKLLFLKQGAQSSFHYHVIKQETFFCLSGKVKLIVGDNEYDLSEPVTIMPFEVHSFYGLTDTVILEISTHHSDDDVERVRGSKGVQE